MQFSAQELTEKLLRALDEDNNVVDMPAVLEVFSSLEKLQVTKDLLEETRLGKYVNEMRKKTSNKDLAKRAKNLVRKWQATVMPTSTNTPHFNGDKVVRHGLPPHVLSSGSKPTSPASRPDTPSSAASSTSPMLPNRLSPKAGFRPVTPGLSNSSTSRNQSPSLHSVNNTNNSANTANRLSKNNKDNLETRNGHSTSLVYHRPLTPVGSSVEGFSKTDVANKRKRREEIKDCDTPVKKSLLDTSHDDVNIGCKNVSVMNGAITSTPKHGEYANASRQTLLGGSIKKCASSDNLKLHINSKQTKLGDSLNCTPLKSMPSDRKDLFGRTPGMKTPRVKTTAQLVAELATSGGLNVADSAAVRKIALNQIDKEIDQDFSPVPAGAKPRARRKPKTIAPPHTSEKSLHETKNEMVHKFLASAMPPHTPDFDLGNSSSNLVQNLSTPSVEDESPNSVAERPQESLSFSHGDVSGRSSSLSSTKDETSSKLLQLVGSKNNSCQNNSVGSTVGNSVKFTLGDNESGVEKTQNSISDPWSLLPPLDQDSIDWNSLSYSPAVQAEVNAENVEKLHSQQWPGVNGLHDHWQNWSDWTKTYSMPSYNGDLLHILPYVVLDDINEEVLPESSP